MNLNAMQVKAYLDKKAEETNHEKYSCQADELMYYVKDEHGQCLNAAQVNNAMYGDGGLIELRYVYQLKDDKATFIRSSERDDVDADADGATPQQMAQWKSSEFVKFFKSQADDNGVEHTFAVAKVAGRPEAAVYTAVLCKNEEGTDTEWDIDEQTLPVGMIMYMTSSIHPYVMEEDKPRVLKGTWLKSPGRNKISGKYHMPENLVATSDLNKFHKILLQKATTAAINHVSHGDGIKTQLNLARAYTGTVARFKDKAFNASQVIDNIGKLEVMKSRGQSEAMVSLNDEFIGKAFWKAAGNKPYYKGHIKIMKMLDDSDKIIEAASLLLQAGSVRKIRPLNEPVRPAPINTPFENLELPKAENAKDEAPVSDEAAPSEAPLTGC